MTEAVQICRHGVKLTLICLQVMSFSAVPATATLPFQFNCTFIAVVTSSLYFLFIYLFFIKMAFLACNTGVCVCLSKNESGVLVA